MIRYIARRLLQGLAVMWMVATAVFVIFRIVPGDPAAMTLGFDAPPETYRLLRQELAGIRFAERQQAALGHVADALAAGEKT